jgi:hypothetical protein
MTIYNATIIRKITKSGQTKTVYSISLNGELLPKRFIITTNENGCVGVKFKFDSKTQTIGRFETIFIQEFVGLYNVCKPVLTLGSLEIIVKM